ncbi:helix-turn-helix domain-containing protein [Methylibium petroleiphilum]|uniref:Uncharacterized protein n=1 Tax=Methylibium petroleiphilum (strain ATCC BAA-1232 / LMG 22953 / PM1) TaxID=420662 RepID=A2SNN4_METPP|nr:helix-turn-helix transcriptional regulator [Methylibium petroleiphilum]ABM97173.1 hypothetical protein Mpe_B0398 [Methylibium petroleiphilum PM1]
MAKTAQPAAKKTRVARAKPRAEAPEEGDVAEEGPRTIVGTRLINLIRKTLLDRDLPERYVADLMGITSIYWNSMTNGNRRISALPKDKLQRLAEFLEIPLIQVYVLADHFTSADFVVYKHLPGDLERMIEFMRTDPKWLALAPSKKEWDEMPDRTKVLLATLYEQISHRSFLKATKIEIAE